MCFLTTGLVYHFAEVWAAGLAPQVDDLSFDDWWEKASKRVEGQVRLGLNSIIILVAWSIWNHRNGCVFDGQHPNVNGLLASVKEEFRMWKLAGARGLAHILAQLPTG